MLRIITCSDSYYAGKVLISDMVRASAKKPEASFIAIVPEQATLRMQQAVVAAHKQHAIMNIDIVSFERLASKVFQELGLKTRQVLNDTGKVLILRRVLMNCREDLKLYRSKTRMPGFAEQMKSAISELKQYTLDDNDLYLMQESARREGNQLLFDKLQDIRLIYRKFNETIAEKYTTQEEVPDLLARVASQSRIIAGANIYLDGFTGFTPVQYRLIREFLTCSAQVTVSVTIPAKAREQDWMDQFSLSRKTLERLQKIAHDQQIPCEITDITDFTEFAQDAPRVPDAYLLPAPDIDQEIRFIAGRIRNGVRSEGRRYRDYAIVLSDMQTYHKTAEEILAQAGIPCFIDHKKKMQDNVLSRFVICALQAVLERCSFDSMFACLKTRMSRLTPRQICELENYCLAFGVREMSSWKKDFTKNKKRKRAITGEETGERWNLQRLNRSRKVVADLFSEFYETCRKKERTASDYTEALKKLLEKADARNRMQDFAGIFREEKDISRSREYEQIYDEMIRLLDQIGGLMGDEVLTVAEFREILSGAIDEIEVGIIPPALDAVPVCDLVRSRIGKPETLFFAGVNDGKVPQRSAGAGVFTAQERSFLKQQNFELAPDGLEELYTQQFYLYLLFGRPRKALYLSYARRSPEGEELKPSYILEHLEDILPGVHPGPAVPGDTDLWPEQGRRELTAIVGRAAAEKEEERPLVLTGDEQALLHYFADRQDPALMQTLSGAFFTNRVLPLDEQTVLSLYGEELAGSVSRFERFYECPFRHFLDYGVRLQEREEYAVQASDLGTVYHESLERYSRKLEEEGLTFRTVSDADSDRIVQEAVDEAASGLSGDILRSSGRNQYLLERMVQVTRKTADVLRQQVLQGAYDPACFELAFEEPSPDKAVLRGKIDRVDIYDDGDIFVKIIDYKSGSKAFRVKDIYSGLQLQLTAYLSSAIHHLQEGHQGRTVRPGGVYYYLIQDKYVKTPKEAQEKYCMSGLTNCDPKAVQAVDSELGPGQQSNIVPVEYTKSGTLSSRSVVANDEEFWHLMGFVQGRIEEAARQIRSGDASIHPYCSGSDTDSCRYCQYKSVCKYEPGKWGSDERTLPPDVDVKELEKELYGRIHVD